MGGGGISGVPPIWGRGGEGWGMLPGVPLQPLTRRSPSQLAHIALPGVTIMGQGKEPEQGQGKHLWWGLGEAAPKCCLLPFGTAWVS